jgi:hypothetical protein
VSDFPAPASPLAVRAVDLDHRDPQSLQMTGQPGAIAAGALDPDQDDFPERLEPRRQTRVPGRGRVERRRREQTTAVVQRCRDVDIEMRVDATRDL